MPVRPLTHIDNSEVFFSVMETEDAMTSVANPHGSDIYYNVLEILPIEAAHVSEHLVTNPSKDIFLQTSTNQHVLHDLVVSKCLQISIAMFAVGPCRRRNPSENKRYEHIVTKNGTHLQEIS